uniref:Metalloendopeptidase n=1 Tax=Globodera rostochiensis TaxID=31243 RepID=A0A914I6E2_GLORO
MVVVVSTHLLLLFLLLLANPGVAQFDFGQLLGGVGQMTNQGGLNLGGLFGQGQPNAAQNNDQPPRHWHRGGPPPGPPRQQNGGDGGGSGGLENIGGAVEGILNRVGVNKQFTSQLGRIQIPPIPALAVHNVLDGVPGILRQFLPPQTVGQITAIARQAIESICSSNNCMQQRPEWLHQRASIAQFESLITKTLAPGKTDIQIGRDVEIRLSRTFQVKKALIRKAGLEGRVEPANNGVYQQDLLLTEQQANRAGNSLFFETSPAQKWPVGQPILYMFDQSVPQTDQSAVRAAVQEIQSKSCLTFQESSSKPAGAHLYYVKINNPQFCGLSYVGRITPANPIYLSFQCGNAVGIAIHETMHALGLQHEQLRVDRDMYININWANINPQNYDTFAKSELVKFTSYGVRYDYGSVMHYASNIAAKSPGLKTMTAKTNPGANDPSMGQRRGLSATDVEVLRRMYCMPGCVDANVYCGVWATNNLCQLASTKAWMAQNCRKSCSLCGGG